jgi:hypothetical protein
VARGNFAHHLADLRAIEGRERDEAVVRAGVPGWAELGPRGRDDEERRLPPALGQRAQEVERCGVGPVQILEGEHDRLGPRPGENPRC